MGNLRKRIISMIVVGLTMVSLFSMPVMAMNIAPENTYEVTERTTVPSSATFAGTVYRYNTPTISLGRVTLSGNYKLHIYLPQNNNMDLMQGTLVFRSGTQIIQKQISNLGTDHWVFDASDIGAGIWNVSLTNASAVGTTQKCEVWYRTEF